MLARTNSIARCAFAATLAGLLASAAVPASAQTARPDARWQAWLGCWSPAGSLIRAIGKAQSSVVCVVPTSTASAVDVVTVSDGKIVDRTHVDTDGQPHAISKDGCSGWQSAKWSPSARRVYLKSEYSCSGAPTTHISAVYAMAGSGEWIDVQGMRVDKNSGVHSVRYRETADVGALPEEITRTLRGPSLARSATMLSATTPASLTDIEEASRELDAAVVSTWLIEADKLTIERPAKLNAKELVELADHGVPPTVIDVMLGISYPEVLAVNPESRTEPRQGSDSGYALYGWPGAIPMGNRLLGFDRFGLPIYASDAALYGACSPWMYGPYDAQLNLYSAQFPCGRDAFYNGLPYGYGAYGLYGGYGGYGYGGYYGGGYFGGGPVVVPRPPTTTGPTTFSHGHIVNGKGYVPGPGSSGTATPSGGSSGTASASTTPSSPPPPPPPRTAEPKKP
jgi:hypothetical protein